MIVIFWSSLLNMAEAMFWETVNGIYILYCIRTINIFVIFFLVDESQDGQPILFSGKYTDEGPYLY